MEVSKETGLIMTVIFSILALVFIFRIASGIAAPMVKRKIGKTRSTHVIPAILGSKTYLGGGTCAWYIHAGRFPNEMLDESTIKRMAIPRKTSKLSFRCCGIAVVSGKIGVISFFMSSAISLFSL